MRDYGWLSCAHFDKFTRVVVHLTYPPPTFSPCAQLCDCPRQVFSAYQSAAIMLNYLVHEATLSFTFNLLHTNGLGAIMDSPSGTSHMILRLPPKSFEQMFE